MKTIQIKDLSSLSNNQPVLCTKVDPDKDYVDGRYVDHVKGQKYECVLTGNRFDKIIIKTEEMIPSVSMEMIESCNGAVTVEISGFSCIIYVDKFGNLQVSAKASAVRPIQQNGGQDIALF